MRVLHLLKTSVGATWAWRQIRELIRLGVDVHVALPDGGPMAGHYAAVGATEYLLQADFPIKAPWIFPKLAGKFRKLVDELCPDIIHSHFVGTTLTMRLALGRNHPVPRVFQVPGPLHLEHRIFRNVEIATAGDNDHWVGSCRWTCDRYLRSGIVNKRIFLSYYGTDIDNFHGSPSGMLRRELGLGQGTKIIGMVAYMYAPKRYLGQRRGLKGHEDFIDAAAFCLQQTSDILFVVVGGPWNGAVKYERRIREYAAKRCADRVIFLGTRNDVADLYPDFDVVVHPSHSENVGGAVESLLLGVPTIATRVGGFPDLVHDGKTGWLIPPRDPKYLAETIERVLADPTALEKAEHGKNLAHQLFDVKRTAAEVRSIYDNIVGQVK